MTKLKIRKIPFDFVEPVPFVWNPRNPEFSIMCNAVGILAIAFEKFVVQACKEAMPLITDDAVRAECDAFLRQEGQHARMHRAHVKALVEQYPGVQEVVDEAVASFDHLTATKSLAFRLAYTADLEATFTPIFKLFLDHHETLYAPGDDRVASLFLWHFVEEVEHRSSALVIYRHVVDSEPYRFKVIKEVFSHVVGVYGGAVEGFARVIPAEDAVIDPMRAHPARMYKQETVSRLPVLRKRWEATSDGYPTALADATPGEMIKMAIGLVKSQAPGHDPEHQPLPEFADEWLGAWDDGRAVELWYGSEDNLPDVDRGHHHATAADPAAGTAATA